MQLPANQAAIRSHRIEAAGAITIVFGVLTAVLAAAWVITSAMARVSEEALPLGEAAVGLLVGTGFVLLGWGVLRHMRLCAATAASLAGLILTLQLLSSLLGGGGGGSLYLLVLPVFVIVANWLSWQRLARRSA